MNNKTVFQLIFLC